MMVSRVRYPSFKKLDFRSQRTFAKTLLFILIMGAVLIFQLKLLRFLLPLAFTAYLLYGFIRPRISREMRREIEDEEDDDDESPSTAKLPE